MAVRDHETIILGGLIETDKTDSYSGVPVLMDIPLLGSLFKSTTKTEDHTELIVLIRPTVLPTPEVAFLATKAEKNKMPGVRATENEIQIEENKRIKKLDKEFEGREIARDPIGAPRAKAPGHDLNIRNPRKALETGHDPLAPLLALAAWVFGAGAARAEGPVYGCTENDLDVALAQGGYVYFTQACNITLTAPIEISLDTILNAQGYSVAINGGGIGPIFQVDPGITFSNIGLTISGGATRRPCYILDGAFVTLTNCTVMNNSAAGPLRAQRNRRRRQISRAMARGQNGTRGLAGPGRGDLNLGHLALLNCVLTNNSAIGGAGGQGGPAGPVTPPGGYSGGNGGGGAGGAACGGAVYTAGLGTILASNCTFAANTVTGGAGRARRPGGAGFIAGLPGGGGAGGRRRRRHLLQP